MADPKVIWERNGVRVVPARGREDPEDGCIVYSPDGATWFGLRSEAIPFARGYAMAIDQQRAGLEQPAPAPARTVRVRVAVVMRADGLCHACAHVDHIEALGSWLPAGFFRVSIIEADVPLPDEPATVQGRVVEEGSDG